MKGLWQQIIDPGWTRLYQKWSCLTRLTSLIRCIVFLCFIPVEPLSKDLEIWIFLSTYFRFCAVAYIFTAHKQSLRRLCFYRCLSVHNGGRACVVALGGACMVFSSGACMVFSGGMHGFFRGAWMVFQGGCVGYDEIRSRSGRYASYWNAFLSSLWCIIVRWIWHYTWIWMVFSNSLKYRVYVMRANGLSLLPRTY